MWDCLSFLFAVLFPEVGLYSYKFPLMNRSAFAVSQRYWNTVSIFNCLKVFFYLAFPCGSDSKESACNVGDSGLIPGSGRFPGGGYGNHSSILAWRVPWTEEPDGLQSMGSQRVGHDWAANTHTFFYFLFNFSLEWFSSSYLGFSVLPLSVSLTRLEKFLASISSNRFSVPCSLSSPSRIPLMWILIY